MGYSQNAQRKKGESFLMNATGGANLHPVMLWSLVLTSIVLVAGITYVYTNRNKHITAILTIVSMCFVILMKVTSIVQVRLQSQFLGGYDDANMTYIAAGPGWGILLHGWHIWLLPVFITAFIFLVLILILFNHQKANPVKLEVHAPIQAIEKKSSTDRLNTFMMVDAAKKQSRLANQKLTEALLNNASYEITISDLNMRITELEQSLEKNNKVHNHAVEIQRLEIETKNKEIENMHQQLIQRSEELTHAQTLLKKIAALRRPAA